jgi:4-hydroxythreonine-4-phosphate dehydrogenase
LHQPGFSLRCFAPLREIQKQFVSFVKINFTDNHRSMNPATKPNIGISCGDLNGIGVELIIKAFSDMRVLEQCTPVIFASNKIINFYRKSIPEINFNYQSTKELNRLNNKQVNVFNCWEEEVTITPGQLNDTGGTYAIKSLRAAAEALKQNQIQGLVTAPIHKKNIQSAGFDFTGHTPFLKSFFSASDVAMMLCSGDFRVALVTEHVPLKEVAQYITREAILSKLNIIHQSLVKDFNIEKPKIAVLGLNPHAGDEGLIGKEEEDIIKPAIKEAKHSMIVTGPYSADAFFARGYHDRFDAVLAMYHDQGLIPFKTLATGDGVNFTAGLPVVRTSPDHGTAFDIAGKNKADASSFLAATFECIDIIRRRNEYNEARKNPLRKMTAEVLANAEDEKIEEQ